MSGIDEYDLPTGWCWASIEDLTSYVQRGKSPQYAARSELPVVNQKCVRWHGVDPAHLKFIDRSQWDAWAPERSLRDGDILWNSTGTGTIGRAAVYRPLEGFSRVVADSHVTIVRLKVGPPEYAHAWIRSPIVQGRLEAMQTGSTNQVELARGEVLRTRVPVAPLNEQRRIVAKLESLQARSRRAREALDAVPALLEKLRQSILAAAFRGDLTKDWRAKHRDVEPASELLKRIRVERRKKWEEAELAKMTAKGKAPRDDGWKGKYKEPEPVDEAGLPELPGGWCWASAEDLCHDITVGHVGPMEHRYVASGVPFLRSQNVRANRFDPSGLRYIPPDFHADLAKSRLTPGDLVIVRSGAPGTACVVPDELVDANCADLVVARLVSLVDPHVMAFYMNSAWGSGAVLDVQVGVAQQHFNVGAMRTLHMPLMAIPEQRVLRERLTHALTAISNHVLRTSELAGMVSTLDRSLLAKAFRGELVPQDPTDEPAADMLARLNSATR